MLLYLHLNSYMLQLSYILKCISFESQYTRNYIK